MMNWFMGRNVAGGYEPTSGKLTVRGGLNPETAFQTLFHEAGGHSGAYHPAYPGYQVRQQMNPNEASELIKQLHPVDTADESMAYGLQELLSRKHYPGYIPREEFLPTGESRRVLEEHLRRMGF